ncbi:tetratricopeptide repeat protein, partial [candidate division KSB3 bacterium]|nr:tetratricopeptide repeat protein [candidate division KSB3 bacterium]
MAKGKVTREQKKLLKTIKKNPQDAAPLVELGWIYFDQKQFNEARQQFTRAAELSAPSAAVADAAYGLGLLDLEGGRHEDARDRLRSLLKDHPDFSKRPEAHFALARANDLLWRDMAWESDRERAASEYLQRAIDHYEQAIERRSAQQDAASLLLGKLYSDIERPDEAFTA